MIPISAPAGVAPVVCAVILIASISPVPPTAPLSSISFVRFELIIKALPSATRLFWLAAPEVWISCWDPPPNPIELDFRLPNW